ncbi:hypothetical protein RXV95_05450 [Novosphingobium sp. ZN18A2]|uniref:hypothetical protein n=1 Tax=Novosphingobium sp. ZN18A2 TaxID=3079861 RepID=UPI0030D01955
MENRSAGWGRALGFCVAGLAFAGPQGARAETPGFDLSSLPGSRVAVPGADARVRSAGPSVSSLPGPRFGLAPRAAIPAAALNAGLLTHRVEIERPPVSGESGQGEREEGRHVPTPTVKDPAAARPAANKADANTLHITYTAQSRDDRLRRTNRRLEFAFQAINALDAAMTIGCVTRSNCREMNPVYGSNPDVGRVIVVKAATSVLHHVIYRLVDRKDPGAANVFQYVSVGIAGGAVLWNLAVVL